MSKYNPLFFTHSITFYPRFFDRSRAWNVQGWRCARSDPVNLEMCTEIKHILRRKERFDTSMLHTVCSFIWIHPRFFDLANQNAISKYAVRFGLLFFDPSWRSNLFPSFKIEIFCEWNEIKRNMRNNTSEISVINTDISLFRVAIPGI